MKQIYFDNGSTSWPKAPGVVEETGCFLRQGAFNINRGNYGGAYEVEGRVLETRNRLASLFHLGNSKNVIFTPGVTYALNMFIKGLLKEGDHVLVSGMEHNAVMRPLKQMEALGVKTEILPTTEEGDIILAEVEHRIKENTKAMIICHASNVCGTIQPIEKLGDICSRKGIFFAVDSAQSAGSVEIDVSKMKIDFLAFAGHKGLLGPQGIGGFLISESLAAELNPWVAGGTGSSSDSLEMPLTLPDRYESGTMNLPGIMGLHASLGFLERESIPGMHEYKMRLAKAFLEGVCNLGKIRVIGKKDLTDRVAVVSLDFTEKDNAVAAFELEQEYGIQTRVGLHCAPLAHRTLGTFPTGSVRVSFGVFNTAEEIEYGVRAIRHVSENNI